MRASPGTVIRRQEGFSLVEIMVGLVIGMLAVIVIMQVFSLSEGRKRTTTGGSDAASEGAIALYALQRDILQAGYGVAALDMFGCSVTVSGVNLTLAPVTVNPPASTVPAGDANTDTLLVFYASPAGQPQGQTGTIALPANTYYVQSSPCSPSVLTLTANAVSVPTTGTLYNLGTTSDRPRILAYAVRNGNLTVCDYLANNCSLAANVGNPAIWVAVASNVVSLRAQYAHDTLSTVPVPFPDPPPNYIADAFDQTAPTGTAQQIRCGWARTVAIRLAMVSRSVQYEKDAVTTSSPLWDGNATAPIDLTLKPDGTANPDWQNYRYKLFQTVVPIRNINWMGMQQAC